MSRRIERVNGVLRQEISRILAAELRDPRLASLVSVTRVDTSSDLQFAKVFVSVLGDQEEKSSTLKALKAASGFIRRGIRHQVTLRAVPSVAFYIDESIERGAELLKLIDEVAPGPDTEQAS